MPEPPEPKHHQLVSPGLEESLRHQEQPIVRTRPTTHTAEAESETCYSRPLIAAAWSRASLSTQGSRDLHGDLETAVFSVRSGSDSFISAPACHPLLGQSAPT